MQAPQLAAFRTLSPLTLADLLTRAYRAGLAAGSLTDAEAGETAESAETAARATALALLAPLGVVHPA